MRQLRAIGYGLARALHRLRRRSGAAIMATGVIAVCFLVVGIVHVATRTVAKATSAWGGAHMVIYLEEGISAEKGQEIRAALDLPGIERSVYVSPDQAMQRLKGALGEHDELLQGLQPSVLPASIEVTLRTGIDDVAATYPVIERLRATPGVADVEFAGEWVDGVSTLLGGLRHAGWVLLLIMGAGCAYVALASIGSSMGMKGQEAEVMRLLGASGNFIRGPLLVEGAVQGMVGAGLAILGLWILFQVAVDGIRKVLGAAFGVAPVEFLPFAHIVLFMAAGAALGIAGSWLAARRHVAC